MKYALIIAALFITSCSQKVVPTTTQSPANTQHMNEAEYIKSKKQ